MAGITDRIGAAGIPTVEAITVIATTAAAITVEDTMVEDITGTVIMAIGITDSQRRPLAESP
jgi:hypothetical protein